MLKWSNSGESLSGVKSTNSSSLWTRILRGILWQCKFIVSLFYTVFLKTHSVKCFFFYRQRSYRYESRASFCKPWRCLLTIQLILSSSIKVRVSLRSFEQLYPNITLLSLVELKPQNLKRFSVIYKYSIVSGDIEKHVYLGKGYPTASYALLEYAFL